MGKGRPTETGCYFDIQGQATGFFKLSFTLALLSNDSHFPAEDVQQVLKHHHMLIHMCISDSEMAPKSLIKNVMQTVLP